MSGLQTIIDNAQSITFDRRKVAGHTVSRSGQLKISSIASNIPWIISVDMHAGLTYSKNRALIEELDRLDRVIISSIDIGLTNPGLSYITEYQGDYTASQIAQISIASYNALELTLDVSAVSGTGAADYVFRKGDFIQPSGAYKYPYTVTADVQRGSGSSILVPLNRPYINQAAYTTPGASIVVGSAVTWQVIMSKKPSYAIVPYNRIEFSSSFELVEVIED